MKIVIFCHNYPPHPGGLEVMVSTLARLLTSDQSVTVVTTQWGGSPLSADGMVQVHRLGAIHLSESAGVPYPLLTGTGLRRAFQIGGEADVIHAHGALYQTTLLARRISRRAGIPLVLTEHVGLVPYRSRSLRGLQRVAWFLLGRRTIADASMVTVINSSVALDMRSLARPVGLRVIPNGVDLNTFRPYKLVEAQAARKSLSLPDDAPLVLFVARGAPRKRLGDLLSIPRRGFRLVVCGGGHSVPSDVIDLGLLPHARMPDLFAAVSLLVHAAEKENTPLVVREALAAGVPAVVRWNPADDESLDRRVVAAYEDPRELEKIIRDLLADASRRELLSRKGRAWAETHWSWERTIESYRSVYSEVLTGRTGSTSSS